MKLFDNYIIDLYGTLIDIHTDESDHYLWEVLAGLYSRYGADYTSDELRNEYHRVVREELEINARKNGVKHSDVKLEKVFLRLLTEARDTHKAGLCVKTKKERQIWSAAVANVFRQLSMRRFGVFQGVHETLKTLKERGARLYLLSNAQRVFTLPEIEKAGLTDFFEATYISSDFGMAKPEPAFLRTLLTEQGLDPSDCVFIGNDVNSDMAVALSCGVHGVLLNTDGRSDGEIDALIGEGKFEVIRSGNVAELLVTH